MTIISTQKIMEIILKKDKSDMDKKYIENFITLMMPSFRKYNKNLLSLICDHLYIDKIQDVKFLSFNLENNHL